MQKELLYPALVLFAIVLICKAAPYIFGFLLVVGIPLLVVALLVAALVLCVKKIKQ